MLKEIVNLDTLRHYVIILVNIQMDFGQSEHFLPFNLLLAVLGMKVQMMLHVVQTHLHTQTAVFVVPTIIIQEVVVMHAPVLLSS